MGLMAQPSLNAEWHRFWLTRLFCLDSRVIKGHAGYRSHNTSWVSLPDFIQRDERAAAVDNHPESAPMKACVQRVPMEGLADLRGLH